MTKEDLKETIYKLILLEKEGVYWDFKEKYHQNKIDLLHDIICLANADYRNERYLIFGVNDNNYDIVEIENDIKTQADFIDTLRSVKFADDIFPDITLEEVIIDEKILKVLIISNTQNKPYYLTEEKQYKGKYLRAGTIYTRIMDTNTPKNKVASSRHIEKMWKERFGLVQNPIHRFEIYLNDFKGWKQQGEKSFYIQHPEFTIQILDDNYCDGAQNEEWARGEIGYYNSSGNATHVDGFFYHSTLLFSICCVMFDGGKKNIVSPDWDPLGKGRIYYYLENSLKYKYQKYLAELYKKDDSINLFNRGNCFSIPLFKNKDELKKFLEFVKSKLNLEEIYDTPPESDKEKQNILFHQNIELYNEFMKN